MSTLSLPSVVVTTPAGYVSRECHQCGAAVFVRDAFLLLPVCPRCEHSRAENEAKRLLWDVARLVRGDAPFAPLPVDERRAQLQQLGLAVEPSRNDADAPPDDARTASEHVHSCRDSERQQQDEA